MKITKSELQKDLEKKFNLVCFEDIGNLLDNSISGLYQCLERNHKQQYLAADRLVFYSRVPVTVAVLDHIDNGLSMLGIEPFFILFCGETDNEQISTNFQQQCLTVSDGIKWSGNCPDLSFLCPMPWTSIQVTNQGKLQPCCVFRGHMADIKETTIKDTFNGPGFQKIRQQLLNREIPSGCKNCFEEEKHNQISNRQRSLITFQKDFFLDTIKDPKIKNLDIRGGITCNMKCRICDENNSSLWAAEKTKQSIIMMESSDWTKQDDQWNQLIELLPQCVNIDFFGGEPLLNKQIYDLFEIAKTTGVAKNIRLNINTNGSIWNTKFIDFFDSFQFVNVGISIDDIGQRFNLQRGSSWEIVQENVRKFLAMNDDHFHAYIFTTVNIQNVYYLPDLLEWAEQYGAEVMLSNLNTPDYLSIDRLTVDAKEIVRDRLSRHPDIRLQNIAIRISKSSGSDGQDFVRFMQDLDQKRQQNFSLAHQEIAKAMGYRI